VAAPVKHIMDDLQFVRDSLRDEGRFTEALDIDILIEAANRAGHQVYTWEGVAESVRASMPPLAINDDVKELIDAALSPPRSNR